MDPPSPAPWTFAARAAYFGDRVCAFCEHHNPASANFCNDCGSPLHLKPCIRCDAVNHQDTTTCYKCGAEFPASLAPREATAASLVEPVSPSAAEDGDVNVAATATSPLFTDPPMRPDGRSLRPDQFLLAYLTSILLVVTYTAYYISASTPEPTVVVSDPFRPNEHGEHIPPASVSPVLEAKSVEPESNTIPRATVPAANPKVPRSVSVRQRHGPEPAARVRATKPSARPRATAPVGSHVADTREALQPDTRQTMHVSLAGCSGSDDLLARIACDQRLRQRLCEGRWGNAPECASRADDNRGQ